MAGQYVAAWPATVIALLLWASPASAHLPKNFQTVNADAAHLPQRSSERDTSLLKCSACWTSSGEVARRLYNVKSEFHHFDDARQRVKEYHVLAAVEKTCEDSFKSFGLLERKAGDRVLPEYFHEQDERGKGGTILKGGWITSLWREECQLMLGRIEDDLYQYFLHGKRIDWCPGCPQDRPKNDKGGGGPPQTPRSPSDGEEL